MEVQRRTRYDRSALASSVLALAAVVTSGLWLLATALACVAIAFALASRKAAKLDDSLRGTGFALAGFLVAVGVLVFVTIGPSVLSLFLFTIAPPPQ